MEPVTYRRGAAGAVESDRKAQHQRNILALQRVIDTPDSLDAYFILEQVVRLWILPDYYTWGQEFKDLIPQDFKVAETSYKDDPYATRQQVKTTNKDMWWPLMHRLKKMDLGHQTLAISEAINHLVTVDRMTYNKLNKRIVNSLKSIKDKT